MSWGPKDKEGTTERSPIWWRFTVKNNEGQTTVPISFLSIM